MLERKNLKNNKETIHDASFLPSASALAMMDGIQLVVCDSKHI
jgi:hypothetical protein